MNNNNDGPFTADQYGENQPVEFANHKTGKHRGRVKPRHLSAIIRQCIVDQFMACHSSEDVAESMGLPVRCVDDVIKYVALRKPPQPERGNSMPVLMARRQA